MQLNWKLIPLAQSDWGLSQKCRSRESIFPLIGHWQILSVDYNLSIDNSQIVRSPQQNWFPIHQGRGLGFYRCSVQAREEAKWIVQYWPLSSCPEIFTYTGSILEDKTKNIRFHQQHLVKRLISVWYRVYVMSYIWSNPLFILYRAD